jgi:predicted nucleic acid-binding protein
VIAIDTSSLVAYLDGSSGDDVDLVAHALEQRQAVLPPVVLTEILSDPGLSRDVCATLLGFPLLDVSDGYWERAGRLRSVVLSTQRKARVADALIAQSCLDASVPLVTRDRDFRHFAKAAGLVLL